MHILRSRALPLVWAVAGLLCLAVPGRTAAAPFDRDYRLYASVLAHHVKGGLVNYAALKADPRDLTAFLDQVAGLTEKEFDGWGANEQVAFLCNVYNATTLQLILENYPLKSIKEIGFLPHAAWRKGSVRLFGRILSLGGLENDLLRAKYPEQPGVHFILVCAARGCPPLRGEPYSGRRLQEQVDEQARAFFADTAKNRVVGVRRTVYLSPIFKWYEADFRRNGAAILDYAERYLPPEAAAELKTGGFRIEYTDYDWGLNDSAAPGR